MTAKEWNPKRLLEVAGGFWQTGTLHAGVKLDLFTAIGQREVTAKTLAERLNVNERALAMLLNALCALGLLKKTADRYANTRDSLAFLSREAPGYIGHIIMHHHHLVDSWSRLDQAVLTGHGVSPRVSHTDDAASRESFLMGMFNLAMTIAPLIVPKIDLTGRRRLLDLGGGPGTYAIHFCRHNPRLTATVYDLPTTRPFAEKTIERFNLSDRIDFTAGDFTLDPIDGTYDTAWLSHVLHAEGPENCETMIEKTVSALEPGGMIVIHEFILNNTLDGPPFPALFSLNMLIGTEKGQAYSEAQIMDMLAGAGVTELRRIPVEVPNDSGIITGIVEK